MSDSMEGFELLTMNWRSALLGLTMVCSAVALAYLARRGIERAAINWLAVLVIAANIAAIPMMIGFAGAYDVWPGLTFLPTQTVLLFGPAIMLHARAMMLQEPDLRPLLLFVPGIAYLLYQLWAFTMLGDYRNKWAFNDAVHEPYVYPLAMIASWVLIAGCLIYVWLLRARYLVWLTQNRSDDDQFSPVWLTHLVYLTAGAGMFYMVESASAQWLGWNYFETFIWDFVALFAIFIITLEALASIDRPFPKMGSDDEAKSIAPTSSPDRDWVLEGTRLKAAVLENKWHLDPSLSLQTLSRRFGMNQVYLSRAINQGLGLNFSGFVNRLRVEYAKSQLVKEDASIIDIALASGFGSKASFNRAFKLHAGCSPSEYRQKHSEDGTSQIKKK